MRSHRMSLRTFRVLSAAALAGLVAILPTASRAADEAVEGKGEAAIVNDDKPAAKERAKKAALRDAVEKTLGTFVSASSETKDFQLMKDKVLTGATGYVSSFEVIDEKEDGGAMVVRVKAKVNQGKINDDAAAMHITLSQMKFPRMAILISEQLIGQAAPSAWWGPNGGGQQPGGMMTSDQRLVENALIGEWTAAGFSFVDMDALAGKIKAAKVVSTNPSADDVRTIGNLSDADVIIVGTAIATKQGNLSDLLNDDKGKVNMSSCKGMITARVFNSDSGEILATGEASKTQLHIDAMVCGRLALQGATKTFAADLKTKVLEAWNKRVNGQSRIRLKVKVDGYALLKEFKNALPHVRGVQSVDQKAFKDNMADFDLKVDGGDAEALAGDLEGGRLGPKMKVKIVGVTSNTIDIELAK